MKRRSSNQPSLFDDTPAPVPAVSEPVQRDLWTPPENWRGGAAVAPAVAKPRLARQCAAILERMRQGPITNHELVQIALNYKARITELRQAGYTVTCVEHNHKTGLTRYVLQEPAA